VIEKSYFQSTRTARKQMIALRRKRKKK